MHVRWFRAAPCFAKIAWPQSPLELLSRVTCAAGNVTLSDPITVLAVDDHPMIREGVAAVIDVEPDMKMVAQGSSGEEAVQLYRVHRPDVVIMDIQMPGIGGIRAMEEIHQFCPAARIIFLT